MHENRSHVHLINSLRRSKNAGYTNITTRNFDAENVKIVEKMQQMTASQSDRKFELPTLLQ